MKVLGLVVLYHRMGSSRVNGQGKYTAILEVGLKCSCLLEMIAMFADLSPRPYCKQELQLLPPAKGQNLQAMPLTLCT
jgi:hypothetical protein